MAEQPGGGGTNWKAMLRDKKLWIGAGVAGVLGLAVFLKRGGGEASGPGAGSPSGTPLAGAGYVAQGGGDTTGTNIASWLSSYSQSMQAQQTQYQDHLTDTITGILEGKGGGQLSPGVYYLENSAQAGKPQWGLLKDGQWLTTGSQAQANSWAAAYAPDQKATYVDQTTWQKLMGGTS